jgi:hypothetical protein
VEVKPFPLQSRGAGPEQNDPEYSASSNQQPTSPLQERAVSKKARKYRYQQNRRNDSSEGMQQHYARVENCRLRKCVEVARGNSEKDNQPEQRPLNQASGG